MSVSNLSLEASRHFATKTLRIRNVEEFNQALATRDFNEVDRAGGWFLHVICHREHFPDLQINWTDFVATGREAINQAAVNCKMFSKSPV